VTELGGRPQTLRPAHCVQDTPGAALAKALDLKRIERVIQKGTDPTIDSYSGFFDNGFRRGTGLATYLRNRGVTDVYVLGLATDYCVRFTALDARRFGFRTHVILDACRGVNLQAGDVDAAVEEMRGAGVVVVDSKDVPAAFASSDGRAAGSDVVTLHAGKHLHLLSRGTWEYAQRPTASGVVTIVPRTDNDELVFTEQVRAPVGGRVIEFPAGLAGDFAGAEGEDLVEAAQRELLEETGYEAANWTRLAACPTSAGLTSETVTFFLATGLRRVADGGGDGSEQITLHTVPVSQVDAWLTKMAESGYIIAAQVYAGLYLAGMARPAAAL
jgi:8-oxo-dGTP pyrophosphatase MutT (NUDIX family)